MVQTLRCTLLNLRRGVTAATKIELRESTTAASYLPASQPAIELDCNKPHLFGSVSIRSSCNSRRSTRVSKDLECKT